MTSIKPKKNIHVLLLILITIGLLLFGLLMIYDASSFEAYQVFNNKFYYVKNQGIWAIFGILILLFLALIPHQKIKNYSLVLIIINAILLLIVLIPGVGTKIFGARRWIDVGSFTIQPSELLKLTLSIYLAAILEKKGSWQSFIITTSFFVALIAAQPDIGTAIVIVTTALIIFFVAGGSIKKLGLLIITGLLIGSLLIFTSSYRQKRVLTFINPQSDPLGSSYHVNQILISLGSGGFWGVGLGQSRQKYRFLPEAPTDSIFAVIAEEVGFIGSSILIFIYLILIYIGLRIARSAKQRYSQLLACGLISWLGIQAFVNFGAMVSLLPLTGIPLPLISYGGSSLIAAMASIGIIINIAKQT